MAEEALELAAKNGHWVILQVGIYELRQRLIDPTIVIQRVRSQNIHLVKKWLPILEKKLESLGENAHADFRVFMSAEPASSPSAHIIPQVRFYKN